VERARARSVVRRVAVAFAAMAMSAIAGLAVASPAQATDVNNYCYSGTPNGDMCYWYQSSFGGAKAGLWQAVPDLLNPKVLFPGPGTGTGHQIANDAGSGANYDTGCWPTIWYAANYTGSHLTLAKYGLAGWYSTTLGVVNNNNRSQNWGCG
jgi:hypothetical protein